MTQYGNDPLLGPYKIVDLEPLPADLVNAGRRGEMLPCPFCGCGQILTAGEKNVTSNIVGYRAFCIECYATVRAQADGKLPDAQAQARASVVQKWNRRQSGGKR